jgi:hypothetical protein
MPDPDPATKTCLGCNVDKPLDDFPKYARSKDGRSNRCRACAKIMRGERKTLVEAIDRNLARENEAPLELTDLQKLLRSPTDSVPKSLRKPLTAEQKIARNTAAKNRRAAAKVAR